VEITNAQLLKLGWDNDVIYAGEKKYAEKNSFRSGFFKK
jgi:hypothetical protein